MANYSQQRLYRHLRSTNHYSIAILGSGLSACIAHQLIPNSIIITKKRDNIFLKNVFVHDKIETRLMLKLLGIHGFKSRKVPFYYFDNATGVMHNEIDEVTHRQIIKEKMGKLELTSMDDISISTKVNLDEEFYYLDFNENNFIEILNSQNSAILDFKGIKENKEVVEIMTDHGPLYFDHIINTIPRYAFDELSGQHNNKYEHEAVHFVVTEQPVLPCIRDANYMVYTFNDCNWKRILCKNHVAAIEYSKPSNPKIDFPEIGNNYQTQTLPYGRIISQDLTDTPRVTHVGRFAEWNHKISTEHVINKLSKINL